MDGHGGQTGRRQKGSADRMTDNKNKNCHPTWRLTGQRAELLPMGPGGLVWGTEDSDRAHKPCAQWRPRAPTL